MAALLSLLRDGGGGDERVRRPAAEAAILRLCLRLRLPLPSFSCACPYP